MSTPRFLSGRYELGETLGFGGMSEVHLARDQRLDREVAIKVLRADLARDPSFYLRFRREAQNAAAMNHPSIVAVYDTGEAETDEGPLPYIVMEYVEGRTLRDIVRNDGPLPPRKALEVIGDVCAALDFSHRAGIIHRDVKPANIMINLEGAVKVMDFGIARALADSGNTMTQTSSVIGTAQYLSPEQARGEPVDARSDVYSLGCVLYEVLTGEPPFVGDSPVAVAYQHVREEPRPPSTVHSGVSRELDSIVLKALNKNPANRYQTAAEMRADIIRVLSGQRPSAPLVMTDDDRTTILGPTIGPGGRHRGADDGARAVAADDGDERGMSRWAKWLVGISVLVLLTLIVTFSISYFGGSKSKEISLPDVAGLTAVDAAARLNDLGFKSEPKPKADNSTPVDRVIRTIPGANTSAKQGSTITLEVSTGPQQGQVPDLTGLSFADAAQKLAQAGFVNPPKQQPGPSTPELKDKVAKQDPAANGSTALINIVTLTIGTGPEQKFVPDVSGQRSDVAQNNLTGAGFVPKLTEVDSTLPAGTVVATSPAGGGNAAAGSDVQVQVSRGNQFSMPDLNGKSISDAQAALKAAGWTGSEMSTTDVHVGLDTARYGKVLSQTQKPGSAQDKNATIAISVGTL